MIVTFDTGILVRATERSDGPARRALKAVIHNPTHFPVIRFMRTLISFVRFLSWSNL